VSVIVPTYQRRDLVVSAVESLRAQTAPPDTFEIVVVVDGSTDGTADRVRSLDHPVALRVVEQENRGRAAAINAGTRTAHGEILLFLDDDMKADPRMVEEHLRGYEELDVDAVMGLIDHDPASPVSVISEEVRRDFEKDVREWSTAFGLLPDDKVVVGAQFSVRRDVFERVEGFDESFTRHGRYGHADEDLGVRLRAAGARIAFNGGAVSHQTFVRGFDSVWRQYEQYGHADVRLGRKHPESRQPWVLPPPGTRSRAVAVATLRHPALARRLGDLARPVARALHDRGSTGRLTRKLTYTALFDHRYWLGVATAGGGGELSVGGPQPELLVLAYHRLTRPPDPATDRHATSPDRLLRQVGAVMREGWELVSPDEVAGFLAGRHGLPLRSLLLTFDDGYADLVTEGIAVLQELGAKALAFVVTGPITGKGDWGGGPSSLLSLEQLGSLAGTGLFEIGAHSRTHPELTTVSDEPLTAEIDGPIEDLERLGLPAPRFLAYPHGDHDARVRDAAERYLGAFTVDPGLAGPHTDRLRLPRISVRAGTTPAELVRQVRTLRRKAARRRLRDAVRSSRPRTGRSDASTPGVPPTTEGPASPESRSG
jgi:GT2 family glycosyltransferase/peptidoglycan/xylan/chitin deacetylase (PgdA/CDA1 family)